MTRRTVTLSLLAALAVLAVTVAAPRLLRAGTSDARALDGVWARVEQAGAYRFSAHVSQTLAPQANAVNAGRQPSTRGLYLEGRTDRADQTLHLTVWSEGGSVGVPASGVEFKVEGDRAFARQGGGAWQEADDFTGLFAPGGDFLAYARAAANVQRHPAEVLHTVAGDVRVTRFTFDVDGRRFAEQMRSQMLAQAAREGLPPGVRMDLPRTYVEMTGRGELWVGDDGLPLRQRFDLRFPPRPDAYVPSAQATVDFAGFSAPAAGWTYRLDRAAASAVSGAADALPPTAVMVLAALLVVGLVMHRRSRRVYAGVVATILAAMLATPLLGSSRLYAYSVAQVQEDRTRQAQTAVGAQQDELAAQLDTPSVDPHTDPLAAAAAAQDDTDRYFDPSCTTDPAGDMDGDGLTNLQECLLGTLPDVADTDNDNVDDGVEVAGIRMVAPDQTAQTWYLDPLNQDTNRDGLADGHEWYLDANGDNLPDDTDADGTPDIWDLDNDGDGVPDNLDLSPYATTQGSAAFTDADPFALAVDDLEAGRLVKVEFQLSPTDADHLWYTQNVLDWPDDDRQGPIQDADGLTFFDVDPSTDASPNANGDMRMVPMLEIEIPAAGNNVAEQDILTQFNISVKQTDDKTVTAYVPMQLVTDSVGDKNVAFYGTMFYRAGATWGQAQPVRLVWLVQALVDQCDSYSNNICDGYSAYNDVEIIQIYDDAWYLTGLHVTEEHSAAMDIIYEDPAATTALQAGYDEPFYMDTLYGLLYGLDNTFLAGADCDSVDGTGDCVGDGQLDMDTAEIERRFNHATNAGVSADERWNLPNVLDVDRRTYESIDLAMADTTITQTVGVLDTTFTPAWSPGAPITPTVMYAYEQTYRSLNLDETVNSSPNFSWTDARLQVGFPQSGADAVEPRTMNSVKWTPYAYDPAVGWSMADLDAYYDDLTAQLGVAFSDIADPDEASTEQTMAQVLYVSIYTGENTIVQIGATNITADYEKADQSIAVTIVADTGTILRKVVSSYYSYTPVLNDITEAIGPEASTSEVLAQFIYQSTFKYFTTVTGAAQLAFVAVVALVAAAALFAQYVFHDTSAAWSITAAVSVGVLTTIFSIYKPIQAIVSLAQEFAAISEDTSLAAAIGTVLTDGNEVLSGSRVAGVIGLVIAVGISVGIFTYLLASGKVHAGTIAFNELLATTIASIIVAVVLFVLASTIVGSILIGIVSVIDIILLLLGTGWSITGWITNALAGVIYQYNLLEKVDVEAGDLAMDLAVPDAGLLAGNRMTYAVPITTSLSSTYGKIEENSLIYDLSENDESLSTKLGARSTDWVVGATDTHLYAYVIDAPGLTSTLRAGINVPTPLVLNTAYALRGQSCWVGFCTGKTLKGRSSDDLGEAIVLDVLPATLTEFVDVATWAGGAVRAVDADGDGLLPFDLGGVDPDPTTWDADGDNLADGYELAIRSESSAAGGVNLDPLQADTDGDTLRDDVELRAGTDPGNADSDGDGLADVAELGPDGGWFLAYAPDKQARIWSDPLQSDADGDGLSDFFERSQDTCPDCGPWADPDNPLVYSPVVWNESPVALYVSNSTADDLVKPGASLVYTTTTANNLSAQQRLVGALTLDLPTGFTGAPLDATVDVASGSRESLVSNLTVDAGATGPHVLTSSMNLTDLDATVWSWDTPTINNHGALKGSAKGPAIAATAGWTEPYVLVMHEPPGITGYLVAADGSVTASSFLYDATGAALSAPDVACADNGACLVAFTNLFSNGTAAVGTVRLMNGLGNSSGSLPWAAADSTPSPPVVAGDGSGFLVAWAVETAGGHSLWLQPVANSGKPQGDPQMFAGPDPELGDIALAWDGAAYLAVWQQGTSLVRAVIAADGTVDTPTAVGPGSGWPTAAGGVTAPALAFDPVSQQALLLYRDTSGGSAQVAARRLAATGASEHLVLDDAAALGDPSVTTAACVDTKNGGWIAAWARPGASNVTVQALSPDGILRGAPVTVDRAGGDGLALVCDRPQPRLDLQFEEDAGATTFVDASGLGNDVTCQSTQCPEAGVGGRFGNGVRFDGVDDQLFTTISQSNRAWTQDLWFKTTQQNAGLAHRQTNTKRLFLENGNVCAQVEVVVANANQADKICSSGVNYADDDWHHLSHTADNGVHRLYVDGALAAQSGKVAFAGCSADTCANFTLGQDSAYFAGAMDAARFFDRALSRAEVADAFDAAVAIYDLDEPAGAGTFVNATDNGFDATCSGDSCPTMGVPGVAYTAARFDGVDDFMQVDPAQREVARFSYDFESGVPPTWNIQTTGSVTREGQPTKFLGLFENNTVKLNLQNLPVHDTVEVQFDLYLRGVWTGNNPVDGPDTWAWGVDGQDILRTNFSTQTNMNGAYQFYPDSTWPLSGITFYSNTDCTNNQTVVTQDVADMSTTTVGNNNVSCYTAANNTVALLYQHENYGGNTWLIDPGRQVLPSLPGDIPKDEIGSVRVWAVANQPNHGALGDTLEFGSTPGVVYRIKQTIPGHTAAALELFFSGDTPTNILKTWALDNVVVSVKSAGGSLPLTNSSFTLAAWAKRTRSGQGGILMAQGNRQANQGLHFGFRDTDVFTCAFWNDDLNSPTAYTDDAWHHWACTYDAATGRRTLYRDGVQIAQDTAGGNYVGFGATYIGQIFDNQWRFQGDMDEVAVWSQALTAAEIAALVDQVKVEDESVVAALLPTADGSAAVTVGALTLRETATNLGTDRQTITRTLTVDGDAPGVSIAAPDAGAYIRGGIIGLAGAAQDPTTSVDKVEVQVAGGPWQLAVGTEAWNFYIDSSAHSAGPLTVAVRAVDPVGNISPVVTRQFILDRSAPTATADAATVTSWRDSQGRWHVPLTGTAADPAAGGSPGSGVATVQALLSTGGGALGNGWQADTSGSGAWSVNYVLPKFDSAGASVVDPSGLYTLTVRARDGVGNRTALADYTVAQLAVDATAPVLTLRDPLSDTELITTGVTLRGGSVDDSAISGIQVNLAPAEQLAALDGALAHLLMDVTGPTFYYPDQSGANNPAVCDAPACPTVADGQRDNAAHFADGQGLTIAGLELAGMSFTLGAWAKRDTAGSAGAFIGQGSGDTALAFGFTGDNRVRCGFGGSALVTAAAYTETTWHHWACTFDAAGGVRTIYRDGVQVAQDTAGGYTGAGDVAIGRSFGGSLDEVTIHARALAAYEVANLAAYARTPWQDAQADGSANPTWTFALPTGVDGLEGFYQINVRGVDALGNVTPLSGQRVWRGEIDTKPPAVAFYHSVDDSGSIPTTTYRCVAQDTNLVLDTTCKPQVENPPADFRNGDIVQTTYAQVDPWYASAITDTARLYRVDGTRIYSGSLTSAVSVQTCDRYAHCTVTAAQPAVEAAGAPAQTHAPRGAEALAPSSGTALTSLDPVLLGGDAHDDAGLQALFLKINGKASFFKTWPDRSTTATFWGFLWTPPGEGIYTLQPVLTASQGVVPLRNAEEAAGQTEPAPARAAPAAVTPQAYLPQIMTGGPETYWSYLPYIVRDVRRQEIFTGTTTTLYVDLTPPSVEIGPTELNGEQALGERIVELSGVATDTVLLHRVDIRVDGGPWQQAGLDDDGRWRFPLRLDAPPDGVTVDVTVRAEDVAAHTAETSASVYIDTAAPTPGTVTLFARSSDGSTRPIAPGDTVDDVGALDVRWTAGTDRAGPVRYSTGFAPTLDALPGALTDYDEAGTHTQAVAPGQRWYATVHFVDTAGNVTPIVLGPVYVR